MTRFPPGKRAPAVYILVVIRGPDKGQVFELVDRQSFALGRGDVSLEVNDDKVSRRHAELWLDGGQWHIRDNNSSHGTYVNKQPITNATPLVEGDRIQIGATAMVFIRMVDKPSSDTTAPSTEDLAQDVRDALEAERTHTETLAKQVLEKIQSLPTEPLVDAIRDAIETGRAQNAAVLREILDKVQSPPQPEPLVQAMHEEVTRNLSCVKSVLCELLDDTKTQPSTEQLIGAVRDATRQDTESIDPLLRELLGEVRASRAATESASQAAQAAPNAVMPQQQAIVPHVIPAPALEAVRNQSLRFIDAPQRDSGSVFARRFGLVIAAMIAAILFMFMVAGNVGLLLLVASDRQDRQNEAMLTRSRPWPAADPWLAHIHDTDRPGAGGRTTSLHDVVTADASAEPRQLTSTAVLSSSSNDEQDKSVAYPATTGDLTEPLVAATETANAAGPDRQPPGVTTGLTHLQEAYYRAWETNRPVTVGAGLINPGTGAISEGRVLDPRAAQDAGITNWYEWYRVDDYLERVRLQSRAEAHKP